MIALSSINLNNLGFSFPGCPTGVSVPISIKPNPIQANSSMSFASLSKPAANPTGFGNFSPNNSRSSLESLT